MIFLSLLFVFSLYCDVARAQNGGPCRIPTNEKEFSIQNYIATNCSETSNGLTIAGTNFGYLPALPPQTLEKFKVIKVTSTNIQHLGTLFKEGRFVNLIVLALTNNRITKLNDNTFAAAVELKVLNVSNNLLNKLSDRCLNGLATLEVLDLSANCISCLPNGLFANMPQLTKVRLGDNNLQHMALNMFSTNWKLGVVSLERNNINALEAANGQLSIEQLFLHDNNLNDISGLKSVDRLVILDMSGNPNLDLKDDTFDSVPNLTELGLRNVSFTNVRSIARLFSPLSQVKRIKLARNRLMGSELNAILGLDSLEYLILQKTDLRYPRIESLLYGKMYRPNNEFKDHNIPTDLLEVLNLSSYNRKIRIETPTSSRRVFKNCPKIGCPTKTTYSIPDIIGISLAVLVVICTVIGLVFYWWKQASILPTLRHERVHQDLELVNVEPNPIYDWNETAQNSNDDEMPEPEYVIS